MRLELRVKDARRPSDEHALPPDEQDQALPVQDVHSPLTGRAVHSRTVSPTINDNNAALALLTVMKKMAGRELREVHDVVAVVIPISRAGAEEIGELVPHSLLVSAYHGVSIPSVA